MTKESSIMIYQAPLIGYCGGCNLPGYTTHGFLGNDLDQVVNALTKHLLSNMPDKETRVSTLSDNPWSINFPLKSEEMGYLKTELSKNLPGLRFE